MGRDWRVDTLRGYFLVAMTLGHFPNPVAPFTEYTFGYASSPDGFVFLSGLVSSWVYLPLRNSRGVSAMAAKVYRRAGTIYLTHMLLVTVALLVALNPGPFAHRVVHPLQTFLAGALLWNQGGFDRILPMYCVFLAITPVVFKQFTAGRAWLVGLISASLWMGAQFGIGDTPAEAMDVAPAGFNLCAWQAYFVAGQYLGFRGLAPAENRARKSWAILIACSAAALVLLVDRHSALFGRNPLLGFTGHPDHNPVRFLDAACLGYLLWRIPRGLDLIAAKLRFFQFLNLLGRHSLQVFAFSMLITRFEAHAINSFSWLGKLVVALLTVLTLAIPALVHQSLRKRRQQMSVIAPEAVTVLPA